MSDGGESGRLHNVNSWKYTMAETRTLPSLYPINQLVDFKAQIALWNFYKSVPAVQNKSGEATNSVLDSDPVGCGTFSVGTGTVPIRIRPFSYRTFIKAIVVSLLFFHGTGTLV
jgi:hypothetical protein